MKSSMPSAPPLLSRTSFPASRFPAANAPFAAPPPAVQKGSAFPGHRLSLFLRGSAVAGPRSGHWTLDIFQRLRRPPCGKALPFRGLPLLLFSGGSAAAGPRSGHLTVRSPVSSTWVLLYSTDDM